ncbi:crotonase/enoyl-CoA hydratase family protein [Sphingomonas corticis]|jgi:enoyl-CoA hydratase/carnithine racemase|uniref:Crotonase/enoyl-CoA hydratase family protein n=1 Tax=Sphingomonas corticis TaxID=2722791 RepID=A0ABX1CM56_9SPHN|nr:crotonase/enoyl-CoA hydratase family protein [Sphingomonas corticis]NJR78256.1 crotonase/enoyl-CoA hydratase family protein [Sphingomonas corticis]
MNYEQIDYSVADGIATITLNRPEKLNAFTGVMMAEMIDAFDRIDADDAVRCVIVTGAGRAFCAGADLSAGAKTFDYDQRTDRPEKGGGAKTLTYDMEEARDGGGRLTLRIFRCLKPVIAAVNGAAVGVGSTMQLPMDIRLASESARFGFVFARRGIVPEAASSYFLPRVVGISQALEWCYSGRVFDAQEALKGGLVKEVVSADRLLARANELAREIADNTAPVSVALTRAMLWRGLGYSSPMDAHKVDSRAILSRGRSGDAKEGVTSFLEKRQPVYPDRVSGDMPDFFPWWEEERYA